MTELPKEILETKLSERYVPVGAPRVVDTRNREFKLGDLRKFLGTAVIPDGAEFFCRGKEHVYAYYPEGDVKKRGRISRLLALHYTPIQFYRDRRQR